MPDLPAWASWGRPGQEPWTVGVEEEVMLLDPRSGSVVNAADAVTAALSPDLVAHSGAETHACVLELRTDPHRTVGGVTAQLTALRAGLVETLGRRGLTAAAAGTHPLVMRSEVAVSSGRRYREIEATMRALAHREPTMALHVHVAVPDGDRAVRALDGLRAELPALLALSANSPFWQGADSGFASIRTPVFSMFPRVGIPRRFGSYRAYVDVVDRLLRSHAVREPGFLWWDARLQPRHGTVEVRIMDAQSRVADTAALAALVQCRVHRHAMRAVAARGRMPEVLTEERFLAARDGMAAALISDADGRRPMRDAVADLIEDSVPEADALSCADELARVADLADEPGYARQRRLAGCAGIAALPRLLGEEFTASFRAPVTTC